MVGNWFHQAADFATTWLPLAFFGILVITAWLLWRTVGMMPRIRPTHMDAGSKSQVTWSDVAGVEEVRAELMEVVDFENTSVATALDVARALGDRLWGVRLDTSESLVDFSLVDEMGDFKPTGVNARLVQRVREALDRDGFERVKIVASGGFTLDKIREFEALGVPVDAFGVGSSLIRGANDFTGDVVLTDGRPSGKFGRSYRPSERLVLVT